MPDEQQVNTTDDLNTPELAARTMAQAKAELPTPPQSWEEKHPQSLPGDHPFFGLRVRQLEDTVNQKVIQPFRAGLDNMATDLQTAGETGHTATGGQLTGPTRALASGVGTMLKYVPVGNTVKDTALMAITPTLPEGHLFEGLRVIPSAPMAAEEAAALRQFTGKELSSEAELNAARKTKAEFDANQALAKRQVNTDPKASVPSKNKNVSEMKSSSVTEQKVERGTEPSTAMSDAEKADLRKSTGRDLKSEEDYINARKNQAEWESNKALSAGKVDTDPKAHVASKNRNQTPAKVIQDAGLVHKGELVPGSGVHMFEHPDHPGKTAALQHPFTPTEVKKKMDSKLEEFGVLQPIKFGDNAKAKAVQNLGRTNDVNRNNKIVIEGVDETPKKPAYFDKNRIDPFKPGFSPRRKEQLKTA